MNLRRSQVVNNIHISLFTRTFFTSDRPLDFNASDIVAAIYVLGALVMRDYLCSHMTRDIKEPQSLLHLVALFVSDLSFPSPFFL